MTVDPRFQLTPGEYLIHPDGSASKVVDRHAMTVDEILATGRYRDRRGRLWKLETDWSTSPERSMWAHLRIWTREGGPVRHLIDAEQMRLLIERDQHRGVCPGLRYCESHPVPHVVSAYQDRCFDACPTDPYKSVGSYGSFQLALDAALALAVGAR